MITKKTTSSRAVLMPDGTTTMYTVHITADTVNDIPAPEKDWDAGSRCDVLENGGKTYLLNNAGQWEEVHFFGNGGNSAPMDVTEIVTEAVAQIVADAPEDFDTLKEMSDWIAQHEDSAAAMNTAILQNAKDIDTALVSGANITGSIDFDGVVKSGQYKYSGSPANRPGTQTYGVLLVFNPMNHPYQGSSTYAVQVAFAGVNAAHFGIAATAGVYVRTTANGGTNWSEWLKLAFLDMTSTANMLNAEITEDEKYERTENLEQTD